MIKSHRDVSGYVKYSPPPDQPMHSGLNILLFSNSEAISFSSTLSLHVAPPLRGGHELLAVSSIQCFCQFCQVDACIRQQTELICLQIFDLFCSYCTPHAHTCLLSPHRSHSWYSLPTLRPHRWHRCGHTGDTGRRTGTCRGHIPSHSDPRPESCLQQPHHKHVFSSHQHI